ncbi:MAG: hypothetical protein B6D63_01090 [Candidatus Latescibacteria bacterium 4484_7]|nr:MAG: hypothetical protein B6D63_01090 [Candidatus Latescibacteria bacterium 4484_7]
MEAINSFVDFLHSSVSPIVLISGVGLLLLSLNQRLGRTIDRSRLILSELNNPQCAARDKKLVQLRILYNRSRILRFSIVSISFSILTSSLIIPVLLAMNFFKTNLKQLGVVLFLLSVLGMILSAISLLIDVSLTLKALDLEVKNHIGKG